MPKKTAFLLGNHGKYTDFWLVPSNKHRYRQSTIWGYHVPISENHGCFPDRFLTYYWLVDPPGTSATGAQSSSILSHLEPSGDEKRCDQVTLTSQAQQLTPTNIDTMHLIKTSARRHGAKLIMLIPRYRWYRCSAAILPQSYVYIYYTMWGPPVISWFINPMNTIVISTINHSYWSYWHQLSYRTGAPHCIDAQKLETWTY
jgi:hypothetical protein